MDPTEDGKVHPTAHRTVMNDLIYCLENWYSDVPDVWVGGNIFLCYEEGNPKAVVDPDVLVIEGVEKRMRDNVLLWYERPPSLVVELTCLETANDDLYHKKDVYERIGVAEYLFLDPLAEYLTPRLQRFRLVRGSYRPIPALPDGSLRSLTTGLTFEIEGERIRLRDLAPSKPILWVDEEVAARKRAERRLAEAVARRLEAEERAAEAEERVRRLEKELAELRQAVEEPC